MAAEPLSYAELAQRLKMLAEAARSPQGSPADPLAPKWCIDPLKDELVKVEAIAAGVDLG